jgi:hypothetical protein
MVALAKEEMHPVDLAAEVGVRIQNVAEYDSLERAERMMKEVRDLLFRYCPSHFNFTANDGTVTGLTVETGGGSAIGMVWVIVDCDEGDEGALGGSAGTLVLSPEHARLLWQQLGRALAKLRT